MERERTRERLHLWKHAGDRPNLDSLREVGPLLGMWEAWLPVPIADIEKWLRGRIQRRQSALLPLWVLQTDGFEGNLTSSKWAKMAMCSPDTALRDIQDLIVKRILEKEEGGGRGTSYRINLMP